jgi:hypothetical protein
MQVTVGAVSLSGLSRLYFSTIVIICYISALALVVSLKFRDKQSLIKFCVDVNAN